MTTFKKCVGLIGGIACLVGQRASATAYAAADAKIQFTVSASTGTLTHVVGSDVILTQESALWQAPLVSDADFAFNAGNLFPNTTVTATSVANTASATGTSGFVGGSMLAESHATATLPPGVNATASSSSSGVARFTRGASVAAWNLSLTPFGVGNGLSIDLATLGDGLNASGVARYHFRITYSGALNGGAAETSQDIFEGVLLNSNSLTFAPFADPYVVSGIAGNFTNIRIEWDTFAAVEVNHLAPNVPDGGVTVLMLGGSLLALQAVRRRVA